MMFRVSSIITFIFLCSFSKAQLVYVDVNPDSAVGNSGSWLNVSSLLDLDNDGTNDYRIDVVCQCSSGSTNSATLVSLGNNEIAGDTETIAYYTIDAFELNFGDSINNQPSWIKNGLFRSTWFSGMGGEWLGNVQDKFVGIKFYAGPTLYYGWIRFDVNSGTCNDWVTIKDYAYTTGLIKAGEGAAFSINKNENVSTSFVIPNPITDKGKIIISDPKKQENKMLKVYDVTGKIIKETFYLPTKEIIIYKNQFPSGIYLYQIISDENILTQGKFIIE